METNVQLLVAARDALGAVQVTEGRSRDATVRLLVEEHVGAQERRAPRKRLTHISTVLRHPMRPLDSQVPYPASPLRLRISSELAERARATSLRLPGQPRRRGARDYQARPLTDTVVTAIARREPIRDPQLDGLMPLIRHGAADGLWRLAAAATATRTERELFGRTSDPFATDDPATQELLFNEVAWHSPWRLEVLWQLAEHYLRGPDAAAAEKMLFDQLSDFDRVWLDLLDRSGFEDDGLESLAAPGTNHEGRAGAAVWRARRAAAKFELVNWLADARDLLSRTMAPPGWELRRPEGWVGEEVPAGSRKYHGLVERCQVLELPLRSQEDPDRSKTLVWPLLRRDGDEPMPVPGMDAVLAQLDRIPPVDAAELILHDRCSPVPENDESAGYTALVAGSQGPVEVPAYVARTLGLIDEATLARLLHDAESTTRKDMAEALAGLPSELATDFDLLSAMSCPAQFIDLLRKKDREVEVHETKPRWAWPVVSLADQVVRGSAREVLVWLTQHLRRSYELALWDSQRDAWQEALNRHRS